MEMETSVTRFYPGFKTDYFPACLNIQVCICVCYCLSTKDHVVCRGIFSLCRGLDVRTRCLIYDLSCINHRLLPLQGQILCLEPFKSKPNIWLHELL